MLRCSGLLSTQAVYGGSCSVEETTNLFLMQVELAIPVYGSTQYLNFIKNINQAHTHGGVDLTLLHKNGAPKFPLCHGYA